jgi:hypothetical protein
MAGSFGANEDRDDEIEDFYGSMGSSIGIDKSNI